MNIDDVIKIVKAESARLSRRYNLCKDDIAQSSALKYLEVTRDGKEVNAKYVRMIVFSCCMDVLREEMKHHGGEGHERVGRKAMTNAQSNAIIGNQYGA